MTRKVLITAGAGGIGLAIARAFAASGARVHVLDIDADAVARVTGTGGITGDVADVADAEGIARAVRDATGTLGGLDILVNNAGIAGPTAAVADYPLEDWRKVMDVNVTGTFAVTQAAIPDLVASGSGTILIMSSLAGRFGYPRRSAYASTKWALVGLAKTLAMELGPAGVTCNAILPGAVAGDRMDAVLTARAEVAGTTMEEEREKAYGNQSVRRFVQPEEIAELCLFLAGPAARSISGQTFPIDGDSRSSA